MPGVRQQHRRAAERGAAVSPAADRGLRCGAGPQPEHVGAGVHGKAGEQAMQQAGSMVYLSNVVAGMHGCTGMGIINELCIEKAGEAMPNAAMPSATSIPPSPCDAAYDNEPLNSPTLPAPLIPFNAGRPAGAQAASAPPSAPPEAAVRRSMH